MKCIKTLYLLPIWNAKWETNLIKILEILLKLYQFSSGESLSRVELLATP